MGGGYKHLFGPVASRRLGRSLGVDLLTRKTCTFDCVYCEVGRTTHKTDERASYVPAREVLEELDRFFASGGQADHVTFSGSGEPVLSKDLGFLIRESKRRFAVPVAVITNGTLLWDADVRAELAAADVVVPSLDSARDESLLRVNRPLSGITAARIIEGLRAFAGEFRGRLWLEVLVVEGMNDSGEDVNALVEAVRRIKADKVQLNTVVRPPAVAGIRAVRPERLLEIAELFRQAVATEIIAPVPTILCEALRIARVSVKNRAISAPEAAILETLKRRPCTAQELVAGLSMQPEELRTFLEALETRGRVRRVPFGDAEFYEFVEGETTG